jgi:hypothetical protein
MAMKLPLPFLLPLFLLPTLTPAQDKSPDRAIDASPVAPEDQAVDGMPDADPFASAGSNEVRGIPTARASVARQALRLRLETWEAPALEVAKRLDSLQNPDDLAKLRSDCLNGIEGVNLVHSPLITLDASTRTSTESISERIYPTEYEPPVFPGSVDPAKRDEIKTWVDILEREIGDATPTSFETRNTGQTLEAVAQPVEAETESWDVSTSFDVVAFGGVENHGASKLQITMPMMTSFRTGGLIRLKEGQWRLLSVMEPPRGLDGKPSEKRWITLVRIDPEN